MYFKRSRGKMRQQDEQFLSTASRNIYSRDSQLVELAMRSAERVAAFRAQHGPVRILMRDGKLVGDTESV